MAILDRPLFQRRPTMDQLRQYGLPAFANGGIVYMQKGGMPFFKEGQASPTVSAQPFEFDLGYTESGAISGKPGYQIGGPLTREQYDRLSPEEVFKAYYGTEPQITSESILSSLRNYLSEQRTPDAIANTKALEEEMKKQNMQTAPFIPEADEEEKVTYEMDDKGNTVKVTEKTIIVKGKPKVVEDKEIIKEADKPSGGLPFLKGKAKPDEKPDLETIDIEEKKRLDPRARDIKVKKEQDAIAEGQATLADAGLGDTGGERERLMNLENLVQERSELYKKIIGDPKEAMKQQGFLQLAQFGLNLAAARGGNLAEKIARSAADPLQTFAALAQQAVKDERAIDLLAIEASEEELARAEDEDKAGALGQIAEAFKIAEPGKSQAYYMNKAIDFSNAKSGKSQQEIIYGLADTIFNKRVDSNPEYTFSEAVAEVTNTMGLGTVTGQGGGTEWDEVEVGGVFVGDDGKQYRKTGSAYTAENIELIG